MAIHRLLSVEIEIGSDCNLSCHYCPNHRSSRKSRGLMKAEVFERILDQLSKNDYAGRVCYHFYNEPLLRKDLGYMVRMARTSLPESSHQIYSNGVYLSEERLHELMDAGIEKFYVTKHDGITKIPLDDYYEDLDDTIKKKIIYKNHEELIFTNRTGLVDAGVEGNEAIAKRPCFIPNTTMIFTLKGDVLPCYEDYGESLLQGNVMDRDLRDIWDSESYVLFRQRLKQGFRKDYEACRTCNNLILF